MTTADQTIPVSCVGVRQASEYQSKFRSHYFLACAFRSRSKHFADLLLRLGLTFQTDFQFRTRGVENHGSIKTSMKLPHKLGIGIVTFCFDNERSDDNGSLWTGVARMVRSHGRKRASLKESPFFCSSRMDFETNRPSRFPFGGQRFLNRFQQMNQGTPCSC
jgi:hypothetical protein